MGISIGGDKKYDDPMTMSNNIITEMKRAGIEIDVAPNKLRTVKICYLPLNIYYLLFINRVMVSMFVTFFRN